MTVQKKEIRAIVVDDSPSPLRATSSIVTRQPNLAIVGAASNGHQALTLARTARPDLVLLDLEIPIMDCLEATSCLSLECPAARVVVVTAHNTQESRKLCYERGASGLIAKDALNEELPTIVFRLFSNGE